MNTINFNSQTVIPSKVVCIGRNYVDHIKELNNEMPTEPVVFIKPNSALSDVLWTTQDPISNPKEQIHYEAEICFLIKNNQLAGIGVGLDLTKRQVQTELKAKGLPWERAKAFDGSAVFSEFIACEGNLSDYEMVLTINNEVAQQANVELMIHKPEALISEVSRFMSLADGDILMTGTPKGVGEVKEGDVFHIQLTHRATSVIRQTWHATSRS
ncbi:fumarylacetoacetate hydrolase family protein [Psychrosphaera ytuae]|uniref:Fumarylacetoacetate hydrolase family protein n=1 Tax=Psychrosphaera ytuae TaxID=2820710 RepID=A0A975HIB1_9GAMM|nr:fumarylacetoacetate hydrolase family protein [Psychrosphaera ytuae]QTH64017.1 fumarylacetoacetate hydrolase family protein [Psychrosphaera ytuae]